MSRLSQHFTAVTYNARCARSLLTILESHQKRHKPSLPNPILLFALAPSSTTPPEDLSHITTTLAQLYPKHVGCISAPLPYQHVDPRIRGGPHSCTLACAFVSGVSFRSTISGRAEVHVGRWHAARKRGGIRLNTEDSRMQIPGDLSESDGKVNWERVWDPSTTTLVTRSLNSRNGNGLDSETLPGELRNIDPLDIDNIFYFSDKQPEGVAAVLQGAFPHANKLSLIASSTPFITGRPVTLFYNGSILSNGGIGIALTSHVFSSPPVVELSFPPLLALSRNLSVTSSEGNIILSLDSGNPTQLLLSAIRKHGLSSSHKTWVGKEDEFYVGAIDPSTQQISQLHRIIAGDPSRGGIALDAASAPRNGAIVCLYHLPRDSVSDAPAYDPDTIPNISFFVAPETRTASFGDEIGEPFVASNAFLAASENGFTLSRSDTQGPWKCVVPGARTSMRLELE